MKKEKFPDLTGDGKVTQADILKGRGVFQEGGDVDMQMSTLMEPQQEMVSDEEMEEDYLDFILDEALTEEEEDMLQSRLEQDEQLALLFDKVIDVAQEFAGAGLVEGPGNGVSEPVKQEIRVQRETLGPQASQQEEEELVEEIRTRKMMTGKPSPVS
jgi:hypothetical protein